MVNLHLPFQLSQQFPEQGLLATKGGAFFGNIATRCQRIARDTV